MKISTIFIFFLSLWVVNGATLNSRSSQFDSEFLAAPVLSQTVNAKSLSDEPRPVCTSQSNFTNEEYGVLNGIRNERYRWQNFYVYIEDSYDDNDRGIINNAMYRLSQIIPCVRFGIWQKGSNPTGDYIFIKKGQGCSSYVGKRGGRQDMNLQSPNCMEEGIVIHEMIHALGFDHEQCRPDRDDYVTVYWENIQSGYEYVFEKTSWSEYTTFNVPYNYNSIMHYWSTALTKNGRNTMTKKDGGQIPYTKPTLKDTDIQKLQAMYQCS